MSTPYGWPAAMSIAQLTPSLESLSPPTRPARGRRTADADIVDLQLPVSHARTGADRVRVHRAPDPRQTVHDGRDRPLRTGAAGGRHPGQGAGGALATGYRAPLCRTGTATTGTRAPWRAPPVVTSAVPSSRAPSVSSPASSTVARAMSSEIVIPESPPQGGSPVNAGVPGSDSAPPLWTEVHYRAPPPIRKAVPRPRRGKPAVARRPR